MGKCVERDPAPEKASALQVMPSRWKQRWEEWLPSKLSLAQPLWAGSGALDSPYAHCRNELPAYGCHRSMCSD